MIMQTQFIKFKTTKSNADIFDKFEKMYCDNCKRYNLLTGYCKSYKQKILHPDESHCSFFIRKQGLL